jgi:hypothetical protein
MFSSNRSLVRLAVEPRSPSVALPKLEIVTARALLGVAHDVGATVLHVPPLVGLGYFGGWIFCSSLRMSGD